MTNVGDRDGEGDGSAAIAMTNVASRCFSILAKVATGGDGDFTSGGGIEIAATCCAFFSSILIQFACKFNYKALMLA